MPKWDLQPFVLSTPPPFRYKQTWCGPPPNRPSPKRPAHAPRPLPRPKSPGPCGQSPLPSLSAGMHHFRRIRAGCPLCLALQGITPQRWRAMLGQAARSCICPGWNRGWPEEPAGAGTAPPSPWRPGSNRADTPYPFLTLSRGWGGCGSPALPSGWTNRALGDISWAQCAVRAIACCATVVGPLA